MATADFRAARQIVRRWHEDAAFALNRFHQKSDGVARNRPLQRVRIAERYALEPGRKGSEAIPILRFRRHADDGDRAPVKIAIARDDLDVILGHTLYFGAP